MIPEPQVYNFVLSSEMSDSILCWGLEKFEVEKPSFAVLLDHTLAVIWKCFTTDGVEPLAINKADIIWALRFLESIDTSRISDTKDLEALIEFFRKTLIALYAMEDERSYLNDTQEMYDSMEENYYKANSTALEEFLSSTVIQEEMKNVKSCEEKTNCSDVELLKRLQELNPMFKSLDDVKTCRVQQKPQEEAQENANLAGNSENPFKDADE